MRNPTSPLLLVAVAFASSAAQANAPATSLTLEVPKSRIELTDVAPAARGNQSSSWELLASSWSPSKLKLASVVPGLPAYEKGQVPYLSISRLSSLASGSLGQFDLKLGLGYYRMIRRAELATGAQARSFEQSVHLIPVRAGLEYRPAFVVPGGIRPYVGAALLPTLALTPRSAVEKGRNAVGLPVEGMLGVLKRFDTSYAPEVDLGASVTAGSLDGASLLGVGVHAGLRLDLGV